MNRTFHWFGSHFVRSALPLQALPPAAARDTQATIDIDWSDTLLPPDAQWTHHWRDDTDVVLSLARHGTDTWLRVPGIADFCLQLQLQPIRLLVSPTTSVPDIATLEHQLVDQILPRLLAQRGELLVHASALAIDNRHALFLGPSGHGKSTLAALLQRRGHGVLSDDCVQLTSIGTRLTVVPTYPSLRLNADSLDAVFPGLNDTTPVAHYSKKRRVPLPVPIAAGSGVDVDALYLLGEPTDSDDMIRITPLRAADTCIALIKHSFRLDLGDRAATAEQLVRCSDIARNIPAFRLDYPRDFGRHEDLARTLAAHLAALPPADQSPTSALA